MVSEPQNHRIQPLNGNNYTTWSEEMKALLHSKGLWRLVDGKEKHPTTGDKEQESWDIKQDKAAGELMLKFDARPASAHQSLAGCVVAYEEFF